MSTGIGVAVLCLLAAAPQDAATDGPQDLAERINRLVETTDQQVRQAIAAQGHPAAKDVLKQRDSRIAGLIGEFKQTDPSAVSQDDVVAVLRACELALRWSDAVEIGSTYATRFPTSEKLWMSLFRSQINLGMVDDAAELLKTVESRFADDSPVRFVHSMLAGRFQSLRRWNDVLEHSVVAAHRRVALIRTHEGIASRAIEDFRRIAEAALALDVPDEGTARLTELAVEIDRILEKSAEDGADPAEDSHEYLSRKLRADVAYWIGGSDMDDQFESWIQYALMSWRSEQIPDAVGQRRVGDVVRYLDKQRGILTPRMLDQVESLELEIESRLIAKPGNQLLKRLRKLCDDLIAREVFRVDPKRPRFGGV